MKIETKIEKLREIEKIFRELTITEIRNDEIINIITELEPLIIDLKLMSIQFKKRDGGMILPHIK